MKICDNLVTASFCLAPPPRCQDMWSGKKIDFSRLNFTFYSILEKHSYCFTFSHELFVKHNIWSLPLGKKKTKKPKQQCFTHVHFMLAHRATCDKTALAWLIVSLVPGYRTAFSSLPVGNVETCIYEKASVHCLFELRNTKESIAFHLTITLINNSNDQAGA